MCDLHEDANDLVEFKQRHANNPGARGHFGETYQYTLDSVRRSHRIVAPREAALRSDADILVNIDADIVFMLNEGVPDSMHPFVNGPLGSYMDHLKGGRKDEGRSSDQDLVVARTEEYWTKGRSAPK